MRVGFCLLLLRFAGMLICIAGVLWICCGLCFVVICVLFVVCSWCRGWLVAVFDLGCRFGCVLLDDVLQYSVACIVILGLVWISGSWFVTCV